MKYKVDNFSINRYRKSGRFLIILRNQNWDHKYLYYKKMSDKMLFKYFNMEWHDNYDKRRFIHRLKELDLINQEQELMYKLL